MILTFENEYGKIQMSGGLGERFWRITAMEGNSLPDKSYHCITYANQDGQSTLSEQLRPRTITIGGDIAHHHIEQELTRVAKILHHKGNILLQSGSKRRKIEARCTSFTLGKRQGMMQPFVLQFICDNPLFGDFADTRVFLFELTPLLQGFFTLGQTVLSSRRTETNVRNGGDCKAEPILFITNIKSDISQLTDATITIHNKTINKQIKFNYPFKKGETVTIDIPSRRMTNGQGESILHTISSDTFLSDFWLDTGNNLIQVLPRAEIDQEISAVCVFTNRYIEAVI